MTLLEGRVSSDFDEFMLRLGHLVVFCDVAQNVRTTATVVQRLFSDRLRSEVTVPASARDDVARYLVEKRLSPIAGNDNKLPDSYKYPDLLLKPLDGDRWSISAAGDVDITVQQQDLWFSDCRLPSKVGAVTLARSRNSGKTGVSHIFDWAVAMELVTTGAQLTDEGRLLLSFVGMPNANPYLIESARLVLFCGLCNIDFDFFAALIPILAGLRYPIAKRDAVKAFLATMQMLLSRADSARGLTARQRQNIIQAAREVGAHEDTDFDRWSDRYMSIAWHRASARFEMLVDFGILCKHQDREQYKYVYRSTDNLYALAQTLEPSVSPDDWMLDHAVTAMAPSLRSDDSSVDLIEQAKALAGILRRPLSLIPISAFSLYLSGVAMKRGIHKSLRQSRRDIEDFARQNPSQARLARGGTGDRAEIISIIGGR